MGGPSGDVEAQDCNHAVSCIPAARLLDDSVDDKAPGGQLMQQPPAKLGRRGARDVPISGLAMLRGEWKLSETFRTQYVCNMCLPTNELVLTNKRIIVRDQINFCCCAQTGFETSIMYRDIVHVAVGHGRDRSLLFAALLCVITGIVLFAITGRASTKFASGLLVTCILIAALLMVLYIVSQYLVGGHDLMIDVCKSNKAVYTWPGRSPTHASKTIVARLPTDEAYAAMNMILEHPLVKLMPSDGRDWA